LNRIALNVGLIYNLLWHLGRRRRSEQVWVVVSIAERELAAGSTVSATSSAACYRC